MKEGTALFKEIGRLRKLKHLSLSIRGFDFEAFLFGEAAGLELECLHADTTSCKDGHIFEEVSSRFSAVIKGDEKRLKIKRIVIYQPLSDSGRCKESMRNSDLEWRDEAGVRTFEYFTGR